MKNTFFALITLLMLSCDKDVSNKSSHTTLNAAQVSDAMINSNQTLGRQYIITVPTGDFTYPTSRALLWLPKNYFTSQKKYPLIINLYGQGQCGYDLDTMNTAHTMSEFIAEGFNPKATNAIDGKTYNFMV